MTWTGRVAPGVARLRETAEAATFAKQRFVYVPTADLRAAGGIIEEMAARLDAIRRRLWSGVWLATLAVIVWTFGPR